MIYVLSWKKVSENTFPATTFKVEENSRTFQDCANPDCTMTKQKINFLECCSFLAGKEQGKRYNPTHVLYYKGSIVCSARKYSQ